MLAYLITLVFGSWDGIFSTQTSIDTEKYKISALSSICELSSILDNHEWWNYSLKVGEELIQFHVDRKGLEQKNTDYTPEKILLGKWNESCEETNNFIPAIQQDFVAVGRMARGLKQEKNIAIGILEGVYLKNLTHSFKVQMKLSETLYILEKHVEGSGFIIEKEGKYKVEKFNSILGVENFLYCQKCEFLKGVQVGSIIKARYESGGKEVSRVKKVWENQILEIEGQFKGNPENWYFSEGNLTFTLGSGLVEVYENQVFGTHTNFNNELAPGDLLLTYESNEHYLTEISLNEKDINEEEHFQVSKVLKVSSEEDLIINSDIDENYPIPYYIHKKNYFSFDDWNPICPEFLKLEVNEYWNECFNVYEDEVFHFTYSTDEEYLAGLVFTFYTDESFIKLELEDSRFGRPSYIFNEKAEELFFTKQIEFKPENNYIWILKKNSTLHLVIGVNYILDLKLSYSHTELDKITHFAIKGTGEVEYSKSFKFSSVFSKIYELIQAFEFPPEPLEYSLPLISGSECSLEIKRESYVNFVCGGILGLVEVDEYATCKYRAVVSNPILCPKNHSDITDIILPEVLVKQRYELMPVKFKTIIINQS